MLLCLAHSNLFFLCLALNISEIICMHGGKKRLFNCYSHFTLKKAFKSTYVGKRDHKM